MNARTARLLQVNDGDVCITAAWKQRECALPSSGSLHLLLPFSGILASASPTDTTILSPSCSLLPCLLCRELCHFILTSLERMDERIAGKRCTGRWRAWICRRLDFGGFCTHKYDVSFFVFTFQQNISMNN